MSNPTVRQAMNDEMALVKHRMTAVRGHMYHDVNNKLRPAVDKLMREGQLLEQVMSDVASVLAPVRSVAALLKVSVLSFSLSYLYS